MDPPGATPHGVQLLVWGFPVAAVAVGFGVVALLLRRWTRRASRRAGAAAGGRRHERAQSGASWTPTDDQPRRSHVLLDGAIVLLTAAVERSHEPSSAGHPRPHSGSPRASNALRLRTATPASRPRSMIGAVVVALLLAVPAALHVLAVRGAGATPAPLLPLPPDEREQLMEAKRVALAALRELDFEHAAGHVSDADFADLRARYEAEAAATLRALDRAASRLRAEAGADACAGGTRLAASARSGRAAVALLVFGVAIGVGIVRYTEPDRMADTPPPGSRPLASLDARRRTQRRRPPTRARPRDAADAAGHARGRARQSLRGTLREAIAALPGRAQARPEQRGRAHAHGLIAGMAARGEHGPESVDRALGLFDRALALAPGLPARAALPRTAALRGEEGRRGRDRSWEQFHQKSCRPARIGRAWSG